MVEAAWKADIESKSSTKYLNPLVLNVGSSHHIWSTVRDNIYMIVEKQDNSSTEQFVDTFLRQLVDRS